MVSGIFAQVAMLLAPRTCVLRVSGLFIAGFRSFKGERIVYSRV